MFHEVCLGVFVIVGNADFWLTCSNVALMASCHEKVLEECIVEESRRLASRQTVQEKERQLLRSSMHPGAGTYDRYVRYRYTRMYLCQGQLPGSSLTLELP